jgi:RNA polymerase sigma-70 factor (ECF subfamily)
MDNRERRFEELLTEYRDRIYRLCCAYVRNPADRQDLYQDVLLKIYHGLERFRGQSAIGTWVYRICVNSCIDFLRMERRRRAGTIDADVHDLEIAATSRSVEQRYVESERLQLLRERMDWLSLLDRTLISLYLEDLSYREIADVVGISAQNVGVRLHRIKKQLNEELGGLDR